MMREGPTGQEKGWNLAGEAGQQLELFNLEELRS